MKKIFRKGRRRNSYTNNDGETNIESETVSEETSTSRSHSLQNSECTSHRRMSASSANSLSQIETVLATSSKPQFSDSERARSDELFGALDSVDNIHFNNANTGPVNNENDLYSLESKPLSDTGTLSNKKLERFQLQTSYEQNFTNYLPFTIIRLRLEAAQNTAINNTTTNTSNTRMNSSYLSDISTGDAALYHHSGLNSSEDTVTSALNKYTVMDKPCSYYDIKREIIAVHEIFKSNSTYVFLSRESFNLFKSIRSKEKENFVPQVYREKGMGLPIFKMETHSYLKFENGANMVFHRYYETIPNNTINVSTTSPKTYQFCSIQTKSTTLVKRYIFTFTPLNTESFKVILFQHNSKPIADFVYKNTRFRIFGNSLVSFGAIPNFKLLPLDNQQPSLCDDIVDRKSFKFSSIVKKRKSSSESIENSLSGTSNIFEMSNPFPNPTSPLMKLENNEFIGKYGYFFSKELPPFGNLTDAQIYNYKDYTLLPKKFREQFKFDLYQDSSQISSGTSLDSTLSLNTDTMVLICIKLAIREAVARKNNKVPSNIEMINRYNYMNGSLGLSSGGGLLGSL